MGYILSRRKPADPDQIWRQAQDDLKSADFSKVESALARLKKLRAPTPLDYMLHAQLAVGEKRPDDALGSLAHVPDEHPMGPQARLLAGQIELRRDRARKAEKFLRRAAELDPSMVQAHRELIYIYGMQLRRKELNQEFLALSRYAKLTFENVFHWCLLRNNSWDPKDPVETLSAYVAADPEDRDSRLALAENLRRMGLTVEAENAVAPLAKDDPAAIAARAMIAIDRHDEDRVEQLLATGPAQDPGLALLRGRRALSRRDPTRALRELRIAYQFDPENRETVFGLLSALEMTGQTTEAAQFRDAAAKLERLNSLIQRAATAGGRQNPGLLRDLGEACAALNRNAEARAWYELVIAHDPLDTQAQQALFRLKSENP
jgi:predicted negative regulator of RcsB-dependent stress response